jgi:hypothetical protein
MTNSMLEKAAEAIFLAEGRAKDVEWKDADRVLALWPPQGSVTEYYRNIARAVLTPIREPDVAMLKAAEATGYWYFEETWPAAIDSILEEST